MHGRGHALGERRLDELAALAADPELPPSSACAAVAPRQTSTRGFTAASSRVEPRPAGADLLQVRLLVDPPLAARPAT